MTGGVHAFVQDTHDVDAVSGFAEIDGVAFDVAPPITGPDVIAGRGAVGRFGQDGKCRHQSVDIALRLIDIPGFDGGLPDIFQVLFRPWAERYSAMRPFHPEFEGLGVERAGGTAGFGLDQRGTDGVDFGRPFLFAADQVADDFAVVGIMAVVDLGLDPGVLLAGNGDGLAHACHDRACGDRHTIDAILHRIGRLAMGRSARMSHALFQPSLS